MMRVLLFNNIDGCKLFQRLFMNTATILTSTQTVFPMHLVYLFLAGIAIVVVGTLILLDRKKR